MKVLYEGNEMFLIFGFWDVGLVKVFEIFGFFVFVIMSGGFVYFFGKLDGDVILDEKVVYCRVLIEVMDILLIVDFENGYGDLFEVVVEMIMCIVLVGVVGGLIEDWDGEDIYVFDYVVECMEVVVEVVCVLDFFFVLIGCCENFLCGKGDFDVMI